MTTCSVQRSHCSVRLDLPQLALDQVGIVLDCGLVHGRDEEVLDLIVRVDEPEVSTSRFARAGEARTDQTLVHVVPDEAYPMVTCRHPTHDPRDITRRAIVDHNHFEVVEALAKNGLQTDAEMLFGSIHGNHDRDRRLRHHGIDTLPTHESSQSSSER